MLTIEEIRNAAGVCELKPVTEPAWGGEVYLMRMQADVLDGMSVAWGSHVDETKGVGYRAYVVAWCLCDENNRPMFRDDDDGSRSHSKMWDQLRTESASLVDRLYERASRINGLMPEDVTVKN